MESSLCQLSSVRRSGDADAFRALVRAHAGMVFATAHRITGDVSLAEDVAQETFLELARKGHQAVESVAAWLHRVAWRKACNALRGEVRRKRHEQRAAEVLHAAPADSWATLEPLLDEALESLPLRLRECLVEHYLEGRTQQEVAARLGLGQATVSRCVEAGLEELRRLLRARGVACGSGLALLLSTRTSEAAPAALKTSLGQLALRGGGVPHLSTPITPMKSAGIITKTLLGSVAAAALIAAPLTPKHSSQAAPAAHRNVAALRPAPATTTTARRSASAKTRPTVTLPTNEPVATTISFGSGDLTYSGNTTLNLTGTLEVNSVVEFDSYTLVTAGTLTLAGGTTLSVSNTLSQPKEDPLVAAILDASFGLGTQEETEEDDD